MRELIAPVLAYIQGTSVAKKVADAFGVLAIGIVAAILYSGWKAQDDILAALKSKSYIVHVDTSESKSAGDKYWPVIEGMGASVLVINRVELDSNRVINLALHCAPDLYTILSTRFSTPTPFVSPDGKGAAFTAALLAGSSYDTDVREKDYTGYGLSVPIPNRRGSALAGYVVVLWDKTPTDDVLVRTQEILGEIADILSQ